MQIGELTGQSGAVKPVIREGPSGRHLWEGPSMREQLGGDPHQQCGGLKHPIVHSVYKYIQYINVYIIYHLMQDSYRYCERSKVLQVAQEMRGTHPITLVTTGDNVTTRLNVNTASKFSRRDAFLLP